MNWLGFTFLIFFVNFCRGNFPGNDSRLTEGLLNKYKDQIVRDFKKTYLSNNGSADHFIIDVLIYLFKSSKNIFPTAFSNKVSPQCKSDSVLYMEETVAQSIAPNRNPNHWALRTKIYIYSILF